MDNERNEPSGAKSAARNSETLWPNKLVTRIRCPSKAAEVGPFSPLPVRVANTTPSAGRTTLTELEKAGVPASPINSIAEMFADPQAVARGMRMDLEDGHGNALPSVRAPMVMSETPLSYERPSPRLGEHTAEILAELEDKA